MGAFAQDERILMWCLYNEPENTKKGAKSLPLMRKVFEWARSVNPSPTPDRADMAPPEQSKHDFGYRPFSGGELRRDELSLL